MQALLKRLMSVLLASGPIGWISVITLAALGVAGYAIHEIIVLAVAFLRHSGSI